MNTKYIWLLAIFLMFMGCNEEEDFIDIVEEKELPKLTSGSADFSKYVALGASFTAGYTDGALFKAAQENSFPNILSKMFANASGGAFTQPLMNDNTGAMIVGGVPVIGYRLIFNGKTPQRLNDFLANLGAAVPPIGTDSAVNLGSSFNNMGVPGAKSFHLIAPNYGLPNPYFGRMATSPTATMLGDAVSQKPTFFTLSEIGGNDVLSYAISGGTGTDQTGNLNVATYENDDITDPGLFQIVLNDIVSQLTANGAKGLITNVPSVTSLPHFTTVPYNPIPLDAQTAGFLNGASAYGAYNGGIKQAFTFLVAFNLITREKADVEIVKRTISFEASPNNAVVIMDENLTDLTFLHKDLISMRQATKDDLFVLPASLFIGTEAVKDNPKTTNGVAIPLADKWVLTPEEQKAIEDATDAYNTTIATIASEKKLVLVDLNAIMTEATTGIQFDDYTLTTDLVLGGLVSLDGIHLTARGYALMANKFLEAIDKTYKSNFVASKTLARAGDFPTNYSPTLK